jgi:pentatricopeptide repeat protein
LEATTEPEQLPEDGEDDETGKAYTEEQVQEDSPLSRWADEHEDEDDSFLIQAQNKATGEEEEEEVATGISSKLVWADVEEDEFQQTLARNQPEYMNIPADGEKIEKQSRPEVSRDKRSSAGNKRRKDCSKGGGKGFQGESQEKGAAAPFTQKIRNCGRQGDLQGALEGVEEAIAAGLQNTTEVQNALLYALVHCGEKTGTSATDLFAKMKDGKQADVVSFNIMLRAHLDAGQHEKAKELLQNMSEHGISANKVTLNELLGDRVKAADRAGMWRVFDEMRATGFGVTNVACSLALKALTDGTPRTEIKKTLALLEELVEPMDEALCSSAIEACLRVKELDMASAFMANLGNIKAKSKSMGLSPATYGSMIKAHGQARDLEQTWATWNAMFKNGTSPSAVTFGCMVESLVMNGAVDDAWKLVHEMLAQEDHAECVNTVIYSTVMKGFSHARRPEQCFAVLDEMRSRGVEANTITYNTLLDACAKCSAMARVPQVFEEMKLNQIEPDKITYSTLIKGYCLVGDLDCAFDLFEEMKADGKVGLDEIVYNALIDGCGRQQKVQRALQVLTDMRKAKISPSNYTLSIMVKLLGRAHKLNEAIALVDDFRTNYRVRPNVQVYTCLMQACLLNRRVSQALSVYNKMVSELQCLPDQKAFSVLLNGCIQAGALKEAVQVTRCAYLLPGKDLTSVDSEEIVGVEPKIISTIDAKVRAMNVEEDILKDWEEVVALAGCNRSPGGGGGKGKSRDGGKGKGKDWKGSDRDAKGKGRDGKGSGRDGKGHGKDREAKGSGRDGKGKSRGGDSHSYGYM